MTTITIRLFPQLNKLLDDISLQTGIVKASLILFAINVSLRKEYAAKEMYLDAPCTEDTIRSTLRLPTNIKSSLEKKSKEYNISVNTLINQYIYIFFILENYLA